MMYTPTVRVSEKGPTLNTPSELIVQNCEMYVLVVLVA